MTCGKVERNAQRAGAGQPAVRRTPASGDVKHSDRAASALPARHATGARTHAAPPPAQAAWWVPPLSKPKHIGFWLEADERTYWVEVDDKRTLHAAAVLVSPHDKRPTLRRLAHPATLARLQAFVRPPALCALCGKPSSS